MDERMTIRTPEHVELRLLVAGAGNRFLALLADLIVQALLFVGVLAGVGLAWWAGRPFLTNATERLLEQFGVWLVAAFIFLVFLVQWGYFTLFETIWGGQTPGKRLLKIRVVREDGRPIGFAEAAIRNLLRVVLDSQPANLYAVGFVTGMLNARFRRLGDFAAGTVVIRERRRAVPGAVPRLRPTAQPVLAQAGLRLRPLTREEAAMLQAYLRRRDDLDADKRSQMARRVASSLQQRLGMTQPADMSYDAFLEWLDDEVRKTQAFR